MHDDQLNGKVALVTGAGSGLGEATARALAESGCRVVGVDINEESVERVCQNLCASEGRAKAIRCDLADTSSLAEAMTTALETFGRIDAAVNCAGIDHTVSIEDMSIEQWDQVLDVNLRAPFLVAKTLFPIMRAQGGGHIVNIASTASLRVWSDVSAYAASKWGLVGLTRALGVEGREHGIRATTIIPGGMRTHFFDRFLDQGIPMPDEANLQDPTTVARVIVHALTMPPESVMQEVMVTPLNETSWP